MTEQHPPQPGGSTPERFPEYDSTPPPPRPVPAYNAPAPGQANRNGMAIGALVVGVVGVVLAICFAPVGLVLGVVALVLGVLARRKSTVSGGRGQATSGIVLGAVSVVLAVIVLAFVGSIMNKFGDCTNKATQAEQQACIQGKL